MHWRLVPTLGLTLSLFPSLGMAQDAGSGSQPGDQEATNVEKQSDVETAIDPESPAGAQAVGNIYKPEVATESEGVDEQGSKEESSESSEESTEPEIEEQPDAVDNQEIGVAIGVALGGGASPGGLAFEGRYLYRLSSLDWIESSVNFSFGSGDAQCFRDRTGSFVCEHGPASGILAQGNVGIRRYFSGQKQFRPFARAGLGLGLVSFGDDDVRGLAIPLYIGAGVRAEVANRVLVVASATLRSGPSILGQDLGLKFHFTGTISAGVEFTLE